MNVRDILTRPLVTIPSGLTVLDAAKRMVGENLGLLVVCDGNDVSRLVGVVSERDIIRAVTAGKNLSSRVDEISTRQVITVRADANVGEAAKAMNKHGIRHVVVIDEQDTLVGVVSMRDLVGERATLNAILQSHEKDVFVGGD